MTQSARIQYDTDQEGDGSGQHGDHVAAETRQLARSQPAGADSLQRVRSHDNRVLPDLELQNEERGLPSPSLP